jgi:hypothetical protein
MDGARRHTLILHNRIPQTVEIKSVYGFLNQGNVQAKVHTFNTTDNRTEQNRKEKLQPATQVTVFARRRSTMQVHENSDID